jgi:transposase-like protein
MSTTMDEEIKRWTARRKSALVLEIIQGKTTVSEASRQFDLAPSEIEEWISQPERDLSRSRHMTPPVCLSSRALALMNQLSNRAASS